MDKTIYDRACKKGAYVVDEELINAIGSAAEGCEMSWNPCITIDCFDKSRCKFDSKEEFLHYVNSNLSEVASLRITNVDRTIKPCISNEFEIVFQCTGHVFDDGLELVFRFDDEMKYRLFKHKIESIIESKRAGYSFLTRIPLVATGSAFSFAVLCIYTWANSIVFPGWVQQFIVVACYFAILASFFPFSARLKERLLPTFDFRVGLVSAKSIKREGIREKILWGVVVALAVGVVSGMIASSL